MKIYQLREVFDENGDFAHQYLEPAHKPDYLKRHLFNGTPKAAIWNADDAAVEIANPQKPQANFPACFGGTLVADARALSELYPILAESGELLPLRTADGTPFMLVNMLPLFDCVDTERSVLRRLPSGKVGDVVRYEFDRRRLPVRSLFKTTVRPGEMFATEGHLPPASEFKAQVERLGLTGLRFREVWNDDGDPIEPINPFDGVNIYRQ